MSDARVLRPTRARNSSHSFIAFYKYILRSALDPVPIERTTLTNKRILEAEAAEAPDDVDGTNPGMRMY